MAKRDRPILYEVFDNSGRLRVPSNPARPAGGQRAGRGRNALRGGLGELRVSYELASVIALLAVVLGGTLYYFGWVRGQDPDAEVRLAADVPSAGGSGGGDKRSAGLSGNGAGTRTENYWAVRVETIATWRDGTQESEIRKYEDHALVIRNFLVSRGFGDVQVIRHDNPGSRSYVAVYVGRARAKAELRSLRERLKRVKRGDRKPFDDAFIYELRVRN